MAHAAGRELFMRFIHSGGTVTLTGDQRSVSWDDTQSFADTTAGADDGTSQVKTTYSITGSMDFVHNDTDEAYGTILYAGQRGTLEWGQFGSATGKPKYALVIDIESVSNSAEYTSEITKSVSWRNQGDWIENYERSGDTW